MSEFSESLHLRSDDVDDVIALLGAAKVAGYVFPAEKGWVSFVYDGDEPPERVRFDRILAANRGLLLHWDYAEDHGCNVTLYEGKKRAARLKVSFESRHVTFDRDAFVERGLLSADAAERIARWVAHAVPAYTAGEAFGLRHFRWLSFELVKKARALGKTEPPHVKQALDENASSYASAIEVDASGRVRSHEPPLALDEAPGTNRWDVLARTVLRKWVDAGNIELEDDDGEVMASLADALSDVLAQEPSPDAIEEFLLDRPEVAEVFASGAELVRSARAR